MHLPANEVEETNCFPGRGLRVAVVVTLILGFLAGGVAVADWWLCLPDSIEPAFVGRESCVDCHAKQYHQWEGSHHDLAMDRATPETVLGDFGDATLTHFGITSRMFRREERYFVNTEGPDGKMADFEVKYVFGVDPLQQYMVEFDRSSDMRENEIARLQVLRLCWDTKQKRWFHLSPTDVDDKLAPDDILHWTGAAQCWNTMCADCHSTNLRKNFDTQQLVYRTTFSEIDVSCEACHGPGSVHVDLAKSKSLFWDRKHGYGLANLKANAESQIQACAPCHSRRRVIHPGFVAGKNYHDHFACELLQDVTYHADGQIKDEVYVYGSFLQSKMYHKGIKCTDCHDPHTARLKHEGNKVCTSCHEHPAGKYDGPAHHHHKPDSTGASCVECHMPETTYMVVDPRRDHSLRIPRPDLSVSLGVPNACSRCHLDRVQLADETKKDKFGDYADWIAAARDDSEVGEQLRQLDQWALDNVKEWYGDTVSSRPHFAHALTKAHGGQRESIPELTALATNGRVSAMVRATAAYELARFPGNSTRKELITALGDKSPQVRAAAIASLQGLLDHRQLVKHVLPLLEDRRRAVRVEAARVIAGIPDGVLTGAQRRTRDKAIEEYVRGLKASGERAGAHLMLAILYESRGDTDGARKAYEMAMKIEPGVTGPRANLAALLERKVARLQSEMQRTPLDPKGAGDQLRRIARYQKQVQELRIAELELLRRDAQLAPEIASVQYRYGLACYLAQMHQKAEQALLKAYQLEPNTPEFVLALALLYEQQQRFPEAVQFTERLVKLRPDDLTYQNLLRKLSAQSRPVPVGPVLPPN